VRSRTPIERPWAVAGTVGAVARLATAVHQRRAARRYPPRGSTIAVGGLRLHYLDRGSGPPVLFIHGLKGSTAEFTDELLDAVAKRHRTLAFDRPGYGHSEAPRGRCSLDGQARLLATALRRLQAAPAVVVGHSFGAAVALRLALEHPDTVAAVVSLAGHTLPFGGRGSLSSRLATAPVLGRPFAKTLVTPLGLALAPLALRRIAAPQRPPRVYAREASTLALRPRQFEASAADAVWMDREIMAQYRRYPSLRPPLLVIHGRDDAVVSINEAYSLHRLVPNSRFIELPGAGHMPMFADPGAIAAAIDRAWALAEEEL